MVGARSDASLEEDQRADDRRRAPEYDECWQRPGRDDLGGDDRRECEEQVAVLEAALDASGASGEVRELAGGTLWWSERLARTADPTVVDASPETLALNASRLGSTSHLRYVGADLFEWEPALDDDAACSSFWLSHEPRQHLDAFWESVERRLRPGGRAVLIAGRVSCGRAVVEPSGARQAEGHDVRHRTRDDGSAHRLIKVLSQLGALGALLGARGWQSRIEGTAPFVFGWASPGG